MRSPQFITELVNLPPEGRLEAQPHDCQLWICLGGEANIGTETVRPGEVWLLPDEAPAIPVTSITASRFLRTWVP